MKFDLAISVSVKQVKEAVPPVIDPMLLGLVY